MNREEKLSKIKEELSKIKETLNWISPAIVVSSNVNRVRWNDMTKDLEVTFNDGTLYTYFQVNRSDFLKLINGDAKATTNGSNEDGTWWVGKSSIGAGVHQILDNYRYERD